jgi:uroporphyrin-III C-methyltransferase
LTGHDASGLVPDAIDWTSVSKASPVIIMYMAMKHWDNIRARLLDAGRSEEELVAFVCDATTDKQNVLQTTLGASQKDLEEAGLKPPAIVVVGEAVRLRASLDWLGALDGRVLEVNPVYRGSIRETG